MTEFQALPEFKRVHLRFVLFRRLVFKELDRAGFHSCVRLYQEITIRTPKEIYKEISLETSRIHQEKVGTKDKERTKEKEKHKERRDR